jgi:hypothetical protein
MVKSMQNHKFCWLNIGSTWFKLCIQHHPTPTSLRASERIACVRDSAGAVRCKLGQDALWVADSSTFTWRSDAIRVAGSSHVVSYPAPTHKASQAQNPQRQVQKRCWSTWTSKTCHITLHHLKRAKKHPCVPTSPIYSWASAATSPAPIHTCQGRRPASLAMFGDHGGFRGGLILHDWSSISIWVIIYIYNYILYNITPCFQRHVLVLTVSLVISIMFYLFLSFAVSPVNWKSYPFNCEIRHYFPKHNLRP